MRRTELQRRTKRRAMDFRGRPDDRAGGRQVRHIPRHRNRSRVSDGAMSRSRWVLTSVLTSVLAPSLAASQVTVVPRRGIDWGRLMPSVNAHVDPQDALHRGEIDFVGTGPREVLVSLPTKLVSRRGDELPVSFRAGEVLLAYNRTNTVTAPDPRQPILVHPTARRATPRCSSAAPRCRRRSNHRESTRR